MTRPSTTDRVLLRFTLLLLLFLPLLLLGVGIQQFAAHARALTWVPTPVRVVRCDVTVASGTRSEEDGGGDAWRLDFDVTYDYTREARTHQGHYRYWVDAGTMPPPPERVASMRAQFVGGLGDGFQAWVNPADPTQSMVAPSLVGPSVLIVLGVALLAGVAWFWRSRRWGNPEDDVP